MGVRCVGISARRGLARGEESEEGGACTVERGFHSPWAHFGMFLGGLKINAKIVLKKLPKLSPKVSQNHQNGFQKPSQNGVPKKHRKIVIFSTSNVAHVL